MHTTVSKQLRRYNGLTYHDCGISYVPRICCQGLADRVDDRLFNHANVSRTRNKSLAPPRHAVRFGEQTFGKEPLTRCYLMYSVLRQDMIAKRQRCKQLSVCISVVEFQRTQQCTQNSLKTPQSKKQVRS